MERKWRIYRGFFRLYFNAHHAAPYIASVDQGSQHTEEVLLGWRILSTDGIESHYTGKVKHPDGAPCFWLQGNGSVTISGDGWAYISK